MSIASYAQQAVSYTQTMLGWFPSNHGVAQVLSLGGSNRCVRDMRAAVRPNLDYNTIMNIRRQAGAAKARHCGNCGEYAAVAFDYLMLAGCPYPLEYANYAPPGDHAFVIVGRPLNSIAGNLSTWGREAVICDAWAGKVVPSSDYWSRMPGFPQVVHAPVVQVRWMGGGEGLGDHPDRPGGRRPA